MFEQNSDHDHRQRLQYAFAFSDEGKLWVLLSITLLKATEFGMTYKNKASVAQLT